MNNQEIKQLHGVEFENHPNGLWNTTRFQIGETIIIVKSRQGKGVKFHIMENNEVVKTFRFVAVNFGKLSEIVTKYFNKWEQTKKKRVQQKE